MMLKQGRFILLYLLVCTCISGCLGTLWSGANMVYDRHNVIKKVKDYTLFVKVNNALNSDKKFRDENCTLDLTVFNGDVLLVGHVPTEELLNELRYRLTNVTGYRRLFNQVSVSRRESQTMQDTWITAKIRSRIFADDSIDPNAFKIITSDSVVYLMGDVRSEQAEQVILFARSTSGVSKVLNLMKYLVYQEK